MGWLILVLMAALVLAGLIFIGRLPRRTFEMVAAALMLGAAGYAWQGHPGLAGSPQQPESIAAMSRATDALLTIRSKMDRSFGPAKSWLVTADGLARAGDHRSAAAFLQAGLRKLPEDADLWTALGVEMMLVGQGQTSPSAELAFEKARLYNPRHPGPDYFSGLAALGKGDADATERLWINALTKAGQNAEWAGPIAAQLGALRQMRQTPPAFPTDK